MREAAEFTIESLDANGARVATSGEFFVSIRGVATIRARVVDNEDGTYTVSWKPHQSGRYQLLISHFGVPLPGCPFYAIATTPEPSRSIQPSVATLYIPPSARRSTTLRSPSAIGWARPLTPLIPTSLLKLSSQSRRALKASSPLKVPESGDAAMEDAMQQKGEAPSPHANCSERCRSFGFTGQRITTAFHLLRRRHSCCVCRIHRRRSA